MECLGTDPITDRVIVRMCSTDWDALQNLASVIMSLQHTTQNTGGAAAPDHALAFALIRDITAAIVERDDRAPLFKINIQRMITVGDMSGLD